MKTLQENQRRQDRVYKFHNLDENTYQMFSEFISWHPTLYEGVNLDKATIDYLNNEFWDYRVKPMTFERRYLHALRRSVGRYNNMKAIELIDQVFDITTNHTIRNIVIKTTNDLKKTGTIGRTGTTSNNTTTTGTNDTKDADRQLPMRNNGSGDLEDLFDWSSGSNIKESLSDTESSTNGSTTINSTDTNNLQDLTKIDTTDDNEYKQVEGLTCELVGRVWSYLLAPKAIDYLVSELASCFVLVE